MYTVVRQYSGPGASQLFDVLERQKDEVERLIRGVSGVVSYTLLRTSDGGISVTVCQEKAGADESVRVAADWVRQNAPGATSPPRISEGNTILHFTSFFDARGPTESVRYRHAVVPGAAEGLPRDKRSI